jgi:hypothetical protein
MSLENYAVVWELDHIIPLYYKESDDFVINEIVLK